LQKDLLETDIWLFQMLTSRLIVSLGIWLHPAVYERFPVLLPYAVRDPHSRGNRKRGIPDMWGSPNAEGLFRDDNSLVKTLPRSLQVTSGRNRLYHGSRIGNGFVAAHVWRELPDGTLASRNPWTYSFVPNLVWLPAQVAALTDREGSFVQSFTQALSIKIYQAHPVPSPPAAIAETAWSLLPPPPNIPPQGLPEIEDLNFFEPTAAWADRRSAAVRLVVAALDARLAGSQMPTKVISTRYTEGLAMLPVPAATALRSELVRHITTE
jgi:hypothetical protein